MADISSLWVLLGLRDNMTQPLKRARGELKNFSDGLGISALRYATFGAAAAGAALAVVSFVKAAQEEAQQMRVLDNALRLTGRNYEWLSAQIEDVLAQQQRQTNFSDGEQREALTRLIMSTGDYSEALRTLRVSMDLAASTGMDLTAASIAVQRAVQGNG